MIPMLPRNLSACLSAASFFLLAATGFCAETDAPLIQLGPVIVHPYLSVKETYSDNIYLTPDNTRDDFITTIMPGIFLQMPISRHTLSLGANSTIDTYARYTREDNTDWNLHGAGDFNFGSQTNLKVSDSYSDGYEPRSESSTLDLQAYRNNLAATSLTYNLANISKVQLDYTNTYWKYKSSNYRSRDENTVSAYIYYRFLPKTSVFAEYEFNDVDFQEKVRGLDNQVHSGYLGFTWELSERSRGTVKGGYLHKEFSRDSLRSVNDFTGALDISHYFSDYNSVKLGGARTVNETSLDVSSYSLTTGINGAFTHKFLDRLSASVKGAYTEEAYYGIVLGETVFRRDKVTLAGADVKYQFRRWLEVALEYYWRQKTSTDALYSSTENNASITFQASF